MNRTSKHSNHITIKKGIESSLKLDHNTMSIEKGMSINKIYEKTVKSLVKKDKKVVKPREVFDNYVEVKGKVKLSKKKKTMNWKDKLQEKDIKKRTGYGVDGMTKRR